MLNNNQELIYSEAKERLIAELEEVNNQATKFNFLFAFNAIVVASILTSAKEFLIISRFGVFLLMVTVVLNLIGLKTRDYRRDPDPEKLYENYWNADYNKTKIQVLHNIFDSIKHNSKVRKQLRIIFNFSIILMSIGIILISFSFYPDTLKGVLAWLNNLIK